jgi:hypothetical protein
MQELCVYAGHQDVYGRSSEVLQKLLRVSISSPTIWRLSDRLGKQICSELYQPEPALEVEAPEVIYAQIDGSMIFSEHQWREVKLGRVFSSQAIIDGIGRQRGQQIEHSEYVAHLGGHQQFTERMQTRTDAYRSLGERLVFLSDGARWISQWVSQRYPEATQILDFYHVAEYLGDFASVAFTAAEHRKQWIAQQKALLFAGRLPRVLGNIRRIARGARRQIRQAADRVIGYYQANRGRMHYDKYLREGLYIGSGAIEAAHRTVVQRRMKLSGQRWSLSGAEAMLNLRVASMSNKWNLVIDAINQPVAASA